MDIDSNRVHEAVAARLDEATKFLSDLIATPSLSGHESAAMDLAAAAMAGPADVERLAMDNSLRDDKDYCDVIADLDYQGRSNLRVSLAGAGGGQNLLLNTHIDTVPPSQGQPRPYEPRIIDGNIFGRGACDAKGQVATVFLAMAALRDLQVDLKGNLIAHIVVEEEVGGNGTLAMVRRGEQASGCVVLEPTDMRILTSSRGGLWYRITLRGKPAHSGEPGMSRSALKMAIRVIEILEGYHDRLLAASRGDPAFDKYPNPMPLTVGTLHAGNWPATAPGEATLEGLIGLLPNKTAAEVMDEVTAAIVNEGGKEIADNFDIHFTYRHDSSVCPVDHPVVKDLAGAIEAAGKEVDIDVMTASCDSWFYSNQLDIPTIIFGGGSLSVAHSNEEHMPIAQLAGASEALVNMALKWCRREQA
ncbi:MAG: M20/M25/M40 family metallo-hydrolase [Planctomycetes bacterium]|nr:M20/M25/M40 family metallo-hydrolase [Planctomycetota bacterium]